MPSLYAHNKFGKLVISDLPENIKSVVKKYPNSYRIGLQGPDYLFFYKAFSVNKVNQYGVKLHKSDAYIFIKNAIEVVNKYGTDSAEYSYIIGFICHFALDNACHPYVNESMKETKCGHIEIEGDFEHLLLSEDGFEPAKYPTYKLVPSDYATAKSISAFYEDIQPHTALACMRWMKFIKHLFVAPTKRKQKFLDSLMRVTLHYKSFKGHMIEANVNSHCRKNAEQMYKLLINAVPHATSLINNFTESLESPDKLSNGFHMDFNGNRFDD